MVLIRDRTIVRFFVEHSQAEQQLAAESGSRDQIEAGAAEDDNIVAVSHLPALMPLLAADGTMRKGVG
jgi:hypothetical protein